VAPPGRAPGVGFGGVRRIGDASNEVGPLSLPRNTEKNDDTTHQRKLVTWTKWLAIATFVVALCSAGLGYEAKRGADQQHSDTRDALRKTDATIAALESQAGVMRGQLDEMRADQRPWVSAKISFASPLVYDTKGLSSSFSFDLRNTGKQPAFHVFAQAMILDLKLLNAEMKPFDADTKRLCNEARRVGRWMNGRMIFDYMIVSNDSVTGTDYPIMNRDVVEQYRNNEGKLILTHYVIGCIFYQTLRGENHHTVYLFLMTGMSPIVDKDISIPREQLNLVPIGSYGD
jgi:hypothetical protein